MKVLKKYSEFICIFLYSSNFLIPEEVVSLEMYLFYKLFYHVLQFMHLIHQMADCTLVAERKKMKLKFNFNMKNWKIIIN